MKYCIICGKEAEYKIKGTSNFYCKECAEELFSDLSVLVKIDEEKRVEDGEIDSILKDEETETSE